METQTLFRSQLETSHDTSVGFLPGGPSEFISNPLTTDTELSRSFFASSSVNIASNTSGTLATTDPTNPTRSGSFRDDYLLTGVTVGQQVQVNLNASFDTYLQLVNADTGVVITYDDDSGEGLNSQLTFTVQAGIDYIVRATSYSSGVTGNYTLITDYGTPTSGTPISGNQRFSGTLAATDPTNSLRSGSYYDGYYLTNLVAGQQVQVNLESTFDTYLQLVNADTGAVVAYDDDSGVGLNSQLTFTAQGGINYIVRATSYGLGVTGEYTLTTSSPFSLNGTLDSTDPTNLTRSGSLRDDYYLTNLVAGQQVQVNLNSTAFDTYLQVVNANTGAVITYDDDSGEGLNSQLSFTAQEGIDYILRATSYGSGVIGAYTLSTNYGAFTSGTPISGNQTFNGTLVNTDPANTLRSGSYYDGYLLTNLIAGEQVQVNLNSSAFDSYLQVVNANTGEVVAFNDDFSGLNSQVTFTAQAGVDYIARATSYTSGVTGAYTLTTTYTPAPTPNPGYNSSYGYGLVNAAAAVADALGQSPFADVPNLGGNNWGNDLVNAPEVWARGYTGAGVVVAVIDSGVDITHEDLVNNIWTNSGEIAGNNIDDDGNGYIDDIHGWNFGIGQNNNDVMPGTTDPVQGHGTHVAGTIAAMNNGIGATGVAYDAEIMAIRMGDVSGGYFTNAGSLADAIRYAVDNGANVINMSLGWSDSTELGNAMAYAASHNVVVVSAAGNSGLSSPGVPASYATEYGIAVGAVDSTKTMAYFSNRAGSDSNMQYVVAPGVGVYSTLPGNTYASWNGTSMASPHVAGVAALILSANPNLTAAQVESIITETANATGITV